MLNKKTYVLSARLVMGLLLMIAAVTEVILVVAGLVIIAVTGLVLVVSTLHSPTYST